MKLYIGLMSGTSMDGIDAALIDLENHRFIHGLTCPYTTPVKQELENVQKSPNNTAGYFNQLSTLIGREFANSVLQLLATTPYQPKDIIAIGSHGQTLCHDTSGTIPYTVQLGCAHTIAEATGIKVVADFRTRDLVVGGQGAPFAPIYHQALFKDQGYPLAIVNIGGIANLTYLNSDDEVSGFDLGPGNCLMDAWIDKHFNQDYDKNGQWAASGQIIEPLLEKLLADPYFKKAQPKSIGKEYFSLDWLRKFLGKEDKAVDVQATLLQLTAVTIAEGVRAQDKVPNQLLLCGGGAHNSSLVQALSQLLPELAVRSTEMVNISPDFIEALMFAWLADKTLQGAPLNLQSITGAKHSAILGVIYPAGIDKRNSLAV